MQNARVEAARNSAGVQVIAAYISSCLVAKQIGWAQRPNAVQPGVKSS